MKIQQELLDNIIDEMIPLTEQHYNEIDHYLQRNKCSLDPDYDKYFLIEESGGLQIVTAREDDNRLIGYVFYLVDTHAHYSGVTFGYCDILFVDPGYRNSGVASEMLLYAEKNIGCDYMTLSEKPGHEFPRLISSLNYELLETTYVKRVSK